MKLFHLADLHIGKKLRAQTLQEDQAYILDQVVQLAAREVPDAVVIAGDIYDRAVPAAEAVELFDRFVTELTQAIPKSEIMMISGNHDSPRRVNVFRRVLERQHIHMIGLPPTDSAESIARVTLRDEYGPVQFYLLPFVRPSMVQGIVGQDGDGASLSYDEALHRLIGREDVDERGRNVLVSHQFYLPRGKAAAAVERMDSETRTVGDIDEVGADLLARFDYAALGHIHKPMAVGANCYRYSGTPLACSVSEAGQEKAVLLVELKEKGRVAVRPLPLRPLRGIRVISGPLDDVLQQAGPDFATVILTDREDVDFIDIQDRLRNAFPNLLEIRREWQKPAAEVLTAASAPEATDPFALCCEFLGELDDEERELLRDVFNAVGEVP